LSLELETAKYFIYLSNIDEKNGENISLSNNKLQCLLFLLQNYHYEQHNKLYFKENVFTMGEFSPVISNVDKQFQTFGSNNLFLTTESDYDTLDNIKKESIQEIWNYTKNLSTSFIIKSLMENEGIWDKFYKNRNIGDSIPNIEIQEFIEQLS